MNRSFFNAFENVQKLSYLPVAFYMISFVVAFFENSGYFYVMGFKFLGLFDLTDFLGAAIHEIPGAIIAVTIGFMTSLPPSLYQKQEALEVASGSPGPAFGVLGYIIFIMAAVSFVLLSFLIFEISGIYAISVSVALPSLIAIWFIFSSILKVGNKGRDIFYSFYTITFVISFSFASGLDSALSDIENEYEYDVTTKQSSIEAKMLRSIKSGVFILDGRSVQFIPHSEILKISGEIKNVS